MGPDVSDQSFPVPGHGLDQKTSHHRPSFADQVEGEHHDQRIARTWDLAIPATPLVVVYGRFAVRIARNIVPKATNPGVDGPAPLDRRRCLKPIGDAFAEVLELPLCGQRLTESYSPVSSVVMSSGSSGAPGVVRTRSRLRANRPCRSGSSEITCRYHCSLAGSSAVPASLICRTSQARAPATHGEGLENVTHECASTRVDGRYRGRLNRIVTTDVTRCQRSVDTRTPRRLGRGAGTDRSRRGSILGGRGWASRSPADGVAPTLPETACREA
jgi:hypothetical protein